MSLNKLLRQIKNDSDIWQSRIHGIDHWDRVMENGFMVADSNGGDYKVVEYFAYLHDCCRHNEGHDPMHGPRAAYYARRHRRIFDVDNYQFRLLISAVSGHTYAHPDGQAGKNKTLAACWDGDRLDLPRVGITPNPALLFSQFSKDIA